MARRKRDSYPSHHNHERWVISYADFVTLLFAFFVVLFATANADRGKARAVAEAVRAALDESDKTKTTHPRANSGNSDAIKQLEEAERSLPTELRVLMPSMRVLTEKLRPEIQRGEVEIHMEPRGLTVSFKQAATFDSGDAEVKPSAYSAIEKVAEAILALPNRILLEGHTDNLPIHTEHYHNNWSLSAARSVAILDILVERGHVPPERLGVSGYAAVAPIASNDSEDGRAKNRRVDVVILSDLAASKLDSSILISAKTL